MKINLEKLQDSAKAFWSDNYNKVFLAILIFAFAVRLFYFFRTLNQPLWWDEADYVAIAKHIAYGVPYTIDSIRFSFYNLIHAGIFRVGLGENFIRFLNVLVSMGSVVLIYFLGKEMFNKRIALIASALMSVFWLEIFSVTRIFMEVPSVFAWLLCIFVLVKYEKTDNGKFLWILSFLLVIAFLVKFSAGILIVSVIIYFLITRGLNVFKNKDFWIAGGIGIFGFGIYFLSLFLYYGTFFEGMFKSLSGQGGIGAPGPDSYLYVIKNNIGFLFSYFPQYFFLFFIFGLMLALFSLFIGYDLIKKNSKIKFICLLMLSFSLIFVYLVYVGSEDNRYLIVVFPILALFFAYGLDFIYRKIKEFISPEKSGKIIGFIFIAGVLIFAGFFQLQEANNLINLKTDTYSETRDSSLWIKENSNPEDIIFNAALPQNVYYSERKTITINDLQNTTEFDEALAKYNPKFVVLTFYELREKSQWQIEYFQKKQEQGVFIPVKVYKRNGQPIIYVFEYNN